MINSQYYIADTQDKRRKVFDYLTPIRGIIAVDTETTGLDSFTCELLGISLCVRAGEAFYITTQGLNDEELFEVRAKLIGLLESPEKKIVMHNSVFDISVLRNTMGVDCLPRLHADTILMKHTLDEKKPHKLKSCAVKYLGEGWDTPQNDLKESVKKNGGKWNKDEKDFGKADPIILGKYAASDADMTLQLFYKFEDLLNQEGLYKFFYDEEVMPLVEIVLTMHSKGMQVDLEYYQQLHDELKQEAQSIEDEIHADLKKDYSKMYHGMEEAILNDKAPMKSGGNLFKQMFVDEGFPIIYNKKGSPTFAKKVIEQTLEDHPESNLLKWKLGQLTDEEFIALEGNKIHAARIQMAKKADQRYLINLDSNPQLGEILFTHLKEKPIKVTEAGNYQVDEDVLAIFESKYAFVGKIVQMRKANKLLNTYVKAALELNVDGVIHPDWMQFGTESGRFACKNPNYQNLPREDTRIKRGIIARKNMALVGADYSQLEPRCFAHMSREKRLIEAFVKGLDFYGTVAIDFFELRCDANEAKKKHPQKRQDAKEIGLGIAYGMKQWKLAKILDCDVKEAQKKLQHYWNKYPNLKEYVLRCHGCILKKGEIANETGRKRRMDGVDRLKTSRARADKRILNKLLNLGVNFPIQSLAASITNRAMIAINKEFKKRGLKAYILGQIHDEIISECMEEDTQEVAQIMKDKMENTYKLSVPLVAEPKIAKALSETK